MQIMKLLLIIINNIYIYYQNLKFYIILDDDLYLF